MPVLPASAPLPPPTRLWLDGMLAGLYSRSRLRPRLRWAMPADSPVRRGAAVRLCGLSHARPKVTLLWASQTGNIESLTERYATQLMESGFEIRTSCMADYRWRRCAKAQYVLLMSSTFGDGDAPDNGAEFLAQLSRCRNAPVSTACAMRCWPLATATTTSSAVTAASSMRVSRSMARCVCWIASTAIREFQPAADAWLERIIARIKEEDAALHAVPADGMITAVLPGAAPTKTQSGGLAARDESAAQQAGCVEGYALFLSGDGRLGPRIRGRRRAGRMAEQLSGTGR